MKEPKKFQSKERFGHALEGAEFRAFLEKWGLVPVVDPETRVVQFVTLEWANWKATQDLVPPPPQAKE